MATMPIDVVDSGGAMNMNDIRDRFRALGGAEAGDRHRDACPTTT